MTTWLCRLESSRQGSKHWLALSFWGTSERTGRDRATTVAAMTQNKNTHKTELALRRVADAALAVEDAQLLLAARAEAALHAGADPALVSEATSVTRDTVDSWRHSRRTARHLQPLRHSG